MKIHGEFARLRAVWRPLTVSRYLKSSAEPKLHIGCGPIHKAGWLNADKFAANADTYLDATKTFPFQSESFQLAYCEHMIEHLPIGKVQHFLSEVHRVLRPGGSFRITCPDLELFANNYVRGDDAFFKNVLNTIEFKRKELPDAMWLVRSKGGAFMSSVVANFYRHRWMYDFETLESCLHDVGFEQVKKMAFRETGVPSMATMDKPERAYESLYVEATKGP